ncbi:unnamed protein product [Mytilus edulis]|uniref:Uncharacterized protein n=1 Tax=Mytilus edulis TaxID=6550 RepID=A0A8S3VF78_MYTED|nr:unnamed protein product [Mytilus edulis]
MDTLKQHVNFHKPHQTLKDSLSALPDKDYFLIAESPYFPQAGRDFKLLPRHRPGLGTTVDSVELSSGSSTGGVSPPTLPTCMIPDRPVGRANVYIPTFMPPPEPVQFFNYTPPSDTSSSLPPPPFDFTPRHWSSPSILASPPLPTETNIVEEIIQENQAALGVDLQFTNTIDFFYLPESP